MFVCGSGLVRVCTGPGNQDWEVLEIFKLCFNHMIFTVSVACGIACKVCSKNKVVVDVAAG